VLFETPESLEIADTRSEFASYYRSLGIGRALYDLCQDLQTGTPDPRHNLPVRSEAPVLVLTGEYDPAVPVAWGRQAVQSLPNGRHYTLPYTVNSPAMHNDCARQIALDFFADPTAAPDTTCIAQIAPFAFQLPQTTLTLQPLEETAFGKSFTTVIPEGWSEITDGAYAASIASTSAIVYQVVPGGKDVVLPTLFTQLGAQEDVAPVETVTANGLQWQLYSFSGLGSLFDLAATDHDGSGYIIILINNEDNRDLYYEQLFLPAIEAFQPQ
jgi:hypothetical protein